MKYIFFLTAICFVLPALSQSTGGASYVGQIESKANQFADVQNRIEELKKNNFDSYKAEAEKLAELKRSLNSLINEKAEVLEELRKGRFCNGCSRTASQLRKEGVYDVEKHFSSNGGTHPADPKLIAQKSDEFDKKISELEARVKSFEVSENEFTRKRKDNDKQIETNEDKLARLKQEIIALSKQYQEAVIKNAKSLSQSLMEGPMRLVADKHYIEDRIVIIQSKKKDLASEEIKALRESDEKVRLKSDAQTNDYKNKKSAVINNFNIRREQFEKRMPPMHSTVASIKQQIRNIDNKLTYPKDLTEENLKDLRDEKATLQQKLSDMDRAVEEEEAAYAKTKEDTEKQVRELDQKIYEETVDLPKKQREAADMLKKAFQLRYKILDDAYAARNVNLKTTENELSAKKAAARKKFMELASDVDNERVRLLKACGKASASCYGITAHGTIIGNWNSSESCVGQMESARSGNLVYACEYESSVYKSYYASLINGLSDSDLHALQKADGSVRYDQILKKVSK